MNSKQRSKIIRRKARWTTRDNMRVLSVFAPRFSPEIMANIFSYIGKHVHPTFGPILCDDLYAAILARHIAALTLKKTRFIQRIADMDTDYNLVYGGLLPLCDALYRHPLSAEQNGVMKFTIQELHNYVNMYITGRLTLPRYLWWMNVTKESLVIYLGKVAVEHFADHNSACSRTG